jgi:hypothetical protein
MANKGKERPMARVVLDRAVKRFGKGFVKSLLLDGLYVTKDWINRCVSHEIDVLIKTQEETLGVIQDAQGLFGRYAQSKDGIE